MTTIKKQLKQFFEDDHYLVCHQINTFNEFVLNGIKKIMDIEPGVATKNFQVEITNPIVLPPKVTPQECRERNLTYEGELLVDIVLNNLQEQESQISRRFAIGSIPIMIGSCVCLTQNTPDLCEDLGVSRGTFLIKGNTRFLVGQIRAAYNTEIVTEIKKQAVSKKWTHECSMRSLSNETFHSVVLSLKKDKNDNVAVLVKEFKVEIPFDVIFNEDIDEISRITGIEDRSVIRQTLDIELFPHLGINSTLEGRQKLLTRIKTTLLEAKEPTDRDNFKIKRCETAGVLCFGLVRMLFKKFVKSISTGFEASKSLKNIIKNESITQGLNSAFATGNWGVNKSAWVRQGVSQIPSLYVNRSGMISYLRKVNIPWSKESKNIEMRKVHPTGIGFVCPSETAEGQTVGLTLNLSFIGTVSLGVEPSLVCQFLDITNEKTGWDLWLNECWLGRIQDLEQARSVKRLFPEISVVISDDKVEIRSEPGRFVRPMMTRKCLTKRNLVGKTWDDLVAEQFVVWVDGHELEATSSVGWDIAKPRQQDELFEVHPSFIFGFTGAHMPNNDLNSSPRLCYHFAQAKQGIAMFSPTFPQRVETTSHVGWSNQKRQFTTLASELTNMDNESLDGTNVMIAIMPMLGWNQEDSVCLNKAAIERGLFNYESMKTKTITETKNERIDIPREFRKDVRRDKLVDGEFVVREKTWVEENDVLVSMTNRDKTKDLSVSGECGQVHRVVQTTNASGQRMIKIVMRKRHEIQVGDKVACLAQKGTVSRLIPPEDLPFTKHGETPDLIIHPAAFPSRLTIFYKTHLALTAMALKDGKRRDATSFSGHNVHTILKEMRSMGISDTATMFDGLSGKKIEFQVTFAPGYYFQLRHLVDTKVNARSFGRVSSMTRQPNAGNTGIGSNASAMKTSELITSTLNVIGASSLRQECLMKCSDQTKIKVCPDCGDWSGNENHWCEKKSDSRLLPVAIPNASKLVFQDLKGCLIGTKIFPEM